LIVGELLEALLAHLGWLIGLEIGAFLNRTTADHDSRIVMPLYLVIRPDLIAVETITWDLFIHKLMLSPKILFVQTRPILVKIAVWSYFYDHG